MISRIKILLRIIGLVLALAVTGALLLAFWPARHAPFILTSDPATDYAAAHARAEKLLADPAPGIRPECRSTILDHCRRTRDAYVLLHGYTNCPAQFRAFAEQLYKRGANVLMLRLPHHGLADRLTTDQARLTAQEMLDSAGAALDLAHGYGERVIVVGLSINGVTAAWLAQQRGDIALAVVIAPFFTPIGIPGAATQPLANLLLRLPNAFFWWDSEQKENLAGSPVSYPRFATRPLGEVLSLGLDVFSLARNSPPRARRILLVTSRTDTAISLPRVAELAGLWKDRAIAQSFPAEWNVPHDCIDPAQPGAQISLVYPQLIEWMNAELKELPTVDDGRILP